MAYIWILLFQFRSRNVRRKLTVLILRKPFEILPAPVVDSPTRLMSGLLVYQGMRARLGNDRGMMDRGKGIWLETVYLCDSWSAIINHAHWSVPYASKQELNPMTNRKSSGWNKTESDGRDRFVSERIIKTNSFRDIFRQGRNWILRRKRHNVSSLYCSWLLFWISIFLSRNQ